MIPRVIHQIWLGGGEPPLEYQRWADGWRALHPEWEYRRWGDADAERAVNRDLFTACPKMRRRWRLPFIADIMRLEILAEHGGVYVDMDFECQHAIDPLLVGVDAFAVKEASGYVNNAIMGAVAGHPAICTPLSRIRDQIAGWPKATQPQQLTGPKFLTRQYKAGGMPGLSLLPTELFYPYDWTELERSDELFPEAYAIHHWGGAR